MITELFRNLFYAYRTTATTREKMTFFFLLMKLSVKKRVYKKNSKEISEKFFDYNVSGFDYDSLYYMFKEIFCSDDYFFNTSSSHPVIVDCGANIGMATIYFKKKHPDARVIGFEANPHTYQLLKKNIERNNLTNVEVYNVALYDEEKEISFFVHGERSLLGSIRNDRGKGEHLKVNARKISGYIKNIEKIDLMKIDVEGAELNILNDLIESSLIKKTEQYIIEYHHNINNDASALSAFLAKFESNGYNYSIKANYHNIRKFQDILIHFYKRR